MTDLNVSGVSPMEVDPPACLPFPGPSYSTGNDQDVQHIDLSIKSKKELAQLCKDFRLPHSGNKGPLLDRLRAFSLNRDGWKSLLPHTTKMHLGPTAGRVAKHKKQSTKRWELLQEEGAATTSTLTAGLSELGVQQDKHQALLAWAARVVVALPYQPRAVRLQQKPMSTAPPVPVSVPASHVPVSPPSASAIAATSTSNTVAVLEKPPVVNRTLTLANGHVLVFTSDQVPPVPAASFADNIPLLASMWDDHWAEWGNNSYIRIRGVPIALVYWKELYTARQKGGGAGRWKSLKARWSDWKLVAEYWHQRTPQQFWRNFTDGKGKPLDWTAILTAIRKHRLADDSALAQKAKQEYGASFAKHFSYKKGSESYTYQKDADIAKRYRQLQGSAESTT